MKIIKVIILALVTGLILCMCLWFLFDLYWSKFLKAEAAALRFIYCVQIYNGKYDMCKVEIGSKQYCYIAKKLEGLKGHVGMIPISCEDFDQELAIKK